MKLSRSRFIAIFCLLAAGLARTSVLGAAEVRLSAGLSKNTARVGEEIELQIKVDGAQRSAPPPQVALDGLEIRYLTSSQSSSIRGGFDGVTQETHVIHLYAVQPQREGVFTIPSLNVSIDGQHFRTEPVALKVDPGTGGTATVAPSEFKIVPAKKTAYVGEMLPLEMRLTVDAVARAQPEKRPEFGGEGFTKQPLAGMRQEVGRQGDRDVDVFVFPTGIIPSKAGRLVCGPATLSYVALVPRAKRSLPRSRLGMDNFVFGDMLYEVQQRFAGRAEPVEIEVKPLPAAGRPPAFTGAVGQFKFSAGGTPRQVKMGDPVTMKLTVSGRGNFDRIEAPALVDSLGWRAYPPAASFKANESDPLSGTKTFEMAVIPEAKQNAMPRFEFSYFDPETAKYVTLTSEPAPLVVVGEAPPPPSSVAAASEFGAPPPVPPRVASDILGLRYDAGSGSASFEPLYERRNFWLAQAVPLAGLLFLCGMKFFRADASAGQVAAWRREKTSLLSRSHRGELPEAEFLEAAARVIQLQTALATGREPASVDAAAVCHAARLEKASAQVVEEIFSARAELLYAGGGAGEPRLSADVRQRMLTTLDRLERSQAHG